MLIAGRHRYYANSGPPSAKSLLYGVLYGWYKHLVAAIRKPHLNYIENSSPARRSMLSKLEFLMLAAVTINSVHGRSIGGSKRSDIRAPTKS